MCFPRTGWTVSPQALHCCTGLRRGNRWSCSGLMRRHWGLKECRPSKEINLCRGCRDLCAWLEVWLLLNPIHNWLIFLEKSPTASQIKLKAFFSPQRDFGMTPREFAYYIAENWILSTWANYCLSVYIPRAARGSEQRGGWAFKTPFEDNVIFSFGW